MMNGNIYTYALYFRLFFRYTMDATNELAV